MTLIARRRLFLFSTFAALEGSYFLENGECDWWKLVSSVDAEVKCTFYMSEM